MKATLHLKLGDDTLTIEQDIANLQELFRFHSQFAILPKEGPNGESDLYLCYRKAQGKFDYYSVVCRSAKQEFKFGVTMETHELFPKGWEPIRRGQSESHDNQSQPVTSEDCYKLLRKMGLGTVREAKDKIQEILGVRALPESLTSDQLQKLYQELAQEAY